MPTSVRLDPKTESLLNRLVKKTGRTKSQVIRDALTAFAGSKAEAEKPTSPLEEISDLIGCASGGPRDLSTRTGEKFYKLLTERPRR